MHNSAVIIGYGRMGREHAKAYEQAGVPILAAYDINDRAFSAADVFLGGLKIVKHLPDDWRVMVDSLKAPGYVSICSYDDAHAEQIIYALERGHKVIAEKPLCLTRGRLQYIMQFKDAHLSCNLPLRDQTAFAPLIAYGKDAYHIECDYNWGRAHRIGGWRSKCPGYSFVLGAGLHVFDLIQAIGHRRIETVQAVGQKLNPEIDCATFIAVIGELEGGGTFRANINCAFDGNHEHHAVIWPKDGPIGANNHRTDKALTLKKLIQGPPRPGFDAHSVAFAVERALKAGTKERVEYS